MAEQTVVGGPRSRARALVAALVASLALVLAPVSPAAAANGRLKVVVQVPQDIKPGLPNHVLGLYLLHEGEWRLSTRVEMPRAGGVQNFTIYEGTEWKLVIWVTDPQHLGGWYAGAGQLTSDMQDAFTFAGDQNYEIVMDVAKGESFAGTLELPKSFPKGAWVRVNAQEVNPRGEVVETHGQFLNGDARSFKISPVRPGARFVVYVETDGVVPNGYAHPRASGLVPTLDWAWVYRQVESPHVRVGEELTYPPLAMIDPPSVSGKAAVGARLTASPGRWEHKDVAVSYQWLRGGRPIDGATGQSYVPTAADLGARLSAQVRASRPSYGDGFATTDPTSPVVVGASPRATRAPAVSGTAKLGSTLRASSGTWDVPGALLAYTWLRDGKAIPGANGRSYKPTRSDVGKRVAVRVTATAPGRLQGSSTSSAVKIGRVKPKVTVSAKSVKRSKRAKVVVKVRAPGVEKIAGKLTVRFGKKQKSVRLKASAQGKVSVRLPKLTKGKYAVKVTFKPSGSTARYATSAKATKVSLRVK